MHTLFDGMVADEPKDLLNETLCTDLLTIPTPEEGNPDLLGTFAPYKRGWLLCGAYSNDKTKYAYNR